MKWTKNRQKKIQPEAIVQSEIKPGRYRHFKGNEYEVIGTATHSETLEKYVVYRALYGEKKLWIRPAKMWCEKVKVGGEKVPRFAYISQE